MPKRRTKIPTPTWEHEQTGITRKLEANRWQLWATVGIVLLVAASLGVVGWAFLSDYIEDQQRPGSLGLRVADREFTVKDYSQRASLSVEQFGTSSAVVISVSSVAIVPREVRVPLALSGPVFEVRAKLSQSHVQAFNANWSLVPGTSFQADLVQRRYRLYEWLLRAVGSGSSDNRA